MIIPYNQLSEEALQGVIEEFVSREGTDYGHEVSFSRKCAQVLEQLKSGRVVIVYNAAEETVSIAAKDELL